jgi:hypothetical protein
MSTYNHIKAPPCHSSRSRHSQQGSSSKQGRHQHSGNGSLLLLQWQAQVPSRSLARSRRAAAGGVAQQHMWWTSQQRMNLVARSKLAAKGRQQVWRAAAGLRPTICCLQQHCSISIRQYQCQAASRL